MAVLGNTWKLHWRGSTGSHEWNRTVQYTSIYRVETDDPLDQTSTVINWVRDNKIDFLAPYRYGNDQTRTVAVCQRISADRILPSLTHWEVVIDYAPETGGSLSGVSPSDMVDEDGDPSDDPLDWRPTIETGSVQYRRPVELAYYRGGYGASFETKYPVDSYIVPMNSAMVAFSNPPIEEDASRHWIALAKNVATLGGDIRQYENAVDINGFRWDHRGYSGDSGAYEGKIREIKIEPGRFNNVDFLNVKFFIDFAPMPGRTWRSTPIDRGTLLRACDSDPDGRGSVIGDLGQGTPFPASTPRLRVPKDSDGEPIGEVFLLDGSGGPLDTCSGAAIQWATWSHYSEVNFTDIPILQDMIDAVTS